MKSEGIRFNSQWDIYTWLILLFVVLVCLWPILLDVWLIPVILSVVFAAFIIVAFLGTYYVVDRDKLIIYSLFIPSVFPIDKISEIKPTKSLLAAPATSLTHRIAIKFSDKKILKSSMPLIISPVRQKEFVDVLLAVNPNIKSMI